MSYESKEQYFVYHGYALGSGGYIERNGQYLAIPSVAPAALSIAGGESKSVSGPWSWAPPCEPEPPTGFRISFEEMKAKVWSEETDHAWITNTEVRITKFNLCERLRVGLIVSRLRSTHKKRSKGDHPRISFDGSQLWNVSVDGEPITVPIDRVLDDYQTHGELKDVIGGKAVPAPRQNLNADACHAWTKGFCRRNLLDAADDDPEYVRDLARKYKSDKMTRCGIVGDLSALKLKHGKGHGYSIEIEDFGRIFFGEMIVSDGMKQLNMIRWDLGCDSCGGGTAPTAVVNGESMP